MIVQLGIDTDKCDVCERDMLPASLTYCYDILGIPGNDLAVCTDVEDCTDHIKIVSLP